MPATKKEQLITFHRETIMSTAKKLFSEKGIISTTMDDIAKESSYSKSTLYTYFKSKEELYLYIVSDYMQMLKTAIAQTAEQKKDFADIFYGICDALIHFQESYPLYFESILGEISVNPDDFEKQPILKNIYDTGEELNCILETLIAEAAKMQVLRPNLNPLPTAYTLWGSICGVITMAYKKAPYIEQGMHMDRNAFLQHSFDLLLHSVLNPVKEE